MSERYISPCWLIQNVQTGSDGRGNPTSETMKRKVLVAKAMTTQSEFYQSRALGLKTVKTIKIRRFEYKSEQRALFEGEELELLRVDDDGGSSVKLILYKGVEKQDAIT